MDFQIRIRTNDVFDDLIYIQDWLAKTEKGFAFHHNEDPENLHYHIYLFGFSLKADSMRKHLGRYLPSKECYAVGTTAGKNKTKLCDMIAYQYGTEDTLSPPVWSKGYDENRMEVFRQSAEAFYEQKKKQEKTRQKVVTEIMVINQEKIKPDRVWERLMEGVIQEPDKYDGKNVAQIKSMIATSYLRQLKPVPRPSDLHRYSVSLYNIVKYGLHKNADAEIPDSALEETYKFSE